MAAQIVAVRLPVILTPPAGCPAPLHHTKSRGGKCNDSWTFFTHWREVSRSRARLPLIRSEVGYKCDNYVPHRVAAGRYEGAHHLPAEPATCAGSGRGRELSRVETRAQHSPVATTVVQIEAACAAEGISLLKCGRPPRRPICSGTAIRPRPQRGLPQAVFF